MKTGFVDKLTSAIERNNSLLCVGLDPDAVPNLSEGVEEALIQWSMGIIEQTAELVCCYKPNFAFYEQYGPEGLSALRKVISVAPNDIPVLLDAKRGDIGSTAKAYARAAFEVWGADAVTVSPYLGRDSIAPFLDFAGKMVFVLCQTSNPSAAEVQVFGDEPLYQHVARLGQRWGDTNQVGFVVGATQPEALAQVRALAPDRWVLAPGVGAQGGDLAAALMAGLDASGRGMIVPVSRGVIAAEDPRAAAASLRDAINGARGRIQVESGGRKAEGGKSGALTARLHEAGCIKFGNFTLASGKQSPIYVDLRRVISFPDLFRQVVGAYVEVVEGLMFDCLAAVPYAALAATGAVALRIKRPMIYPRKEVKAHGTGQAVEGAFEQGNTALVIEDVMTSGGSILAAIKTLEENGLAVRDVVVLVDREQGGKAMLAEQGYHLHAVLTINQMVDALQEQGCITPEMYQTVKSYLGF